MTEQFKSRFADGKGNIYTVKEVLQTPVGLTVYYIDEGTKKEYSCLLDAFGQRFTEVQAND